MQPLKSAICSLLLLVSYSSADLRSSLAQAQADVLMITSDHEGLPMVLLEAVQLRVAVIARSVGEIPTVLLHGKGGQLIAGTDSADYLAAMMNVLESPDTTATACTVAQENLQREHTADVCAARYLSLCERLRQPAANDA